MNIMDMLFRLVMPGRCESADVAVSSHALPDHGAAYASPVAIGRNANAVASSEAVCRRPEPFAAEKVCRDASGQFWHPDLWSLGLPDSDDDITLALPAAGFVGRWVDGDERAFPDDVIRDGGDRYWDALRAWEPAPPADGGGWKLAAIVDADNGPQALFVRAHGLSVVPKEGAC